MPDMTIIDRETISNAIRESDAELRELYPYGQSEDYKCFAVVGAPMHIRQFLIELAREDYHLATDLNDRMQTDNLGFETVGYFPGYVIEEGIDIAEEEVQAD